MLSNLGKPMTHLAASRYDLPSVTHAPSPWGEGRGLRGKAALACGIECFDFKFGGQA